MNPQSARQAKETSMFMEREKEIHRLSNNFCRALWLHIPLLHLYEYVQVCLCLTNQMPPSYTALRNQPRHSQYARWKFLSNGGSVPLQKSCQGGGGRGAAISRQRGRFKKKKKKIAVAHRPPTQVPDKLHNSISASGRKHNRQECNKIKNKIILINVQMQQNTHTHAHTQVLASLWKTQTDWYPVRSLGCFCCRAHYHTCKWGCARLG